MSIGLLPYKRSFSPPTTFTRPRSALGADLLSLPENTKGLQRLLHPFTDVTR